RIASRRPGRADAGAGAAVAAGAFVFARVFAPRPRGRIYPTPLVPSRGANEDADVRGPGSRCRRYLLPDQRRDLRADLVQPTAKDGRVRANGARYRCRARWGER